MAVSTAACLAVALPGFALGQTATGPEHAASAPAISHRAAPHRGKTTLPSGTPIALQLETSVSTASSKAGEGFAARVMKTVYLYGRPVIPAGSIVEGRVLHVKDTRPAQGHSELLLHPDLLTTPSGQRYHLIADVIQTDPISGTEVDSEGMILSKRGPSRADKLRLIAGGGGGAVTGAVLIGAKAALVGGGVGAAAAAGWWLLRHRHAEMKAGEHLTVRLDQPLRIESVPAMPSRGGRRH